jgi:hypothetical protein
MRPTLHALLCAYNNTDPALKRQKAITPKLLRYLFQSTGLATNALLNSAPAVMADITIAGFFFAMRSCEYSTTPVPGKTKLIILSGIIFRTASKQLIDPTDPILLVLAQYVTITFADQKTGKKMDRQTQQRTDHPFLCPVLRYASVVQHIHQRVPIGLHRPKSTQSVSATKLSASPTPSCARCYGRPPPTPTPLLPNAKTPPSMAP